MVMNMIDYKQTMKNVTQSFFDKSHYQFLFYLFQHIVLILFSFVRSIIK